MNTQEPQRITFFDVVVLVLSVAILFAFIGEAITTVPPEASKVLQWFDMVVCVVFFIDVMVRFRAAPNRAQFMKWGWIDLIACIPNIDVLRWGRMVRVLRIIRVLRGVRAFQRILSIILRRKLQNSFVSVIVTTVLIVVFASTAILMTETGQEANIKTAEDALWWGITTITTVGYGDRYPTTTEGRLIAITLMLAGVGLFGTLSGLIATYFLGRPADDDASGDSEVLARFLTLEAKIDALTEAHQSGSAKFGEQVREVERK
jgi:voltage-gated potassium channel